MLEEHDSVPWDALPGQMTEIGGGEFRLTDRPERLPHSYTLQALSDDRELTRRSARMRRLGSPPWE